MTTKSSTARKSHPLPDDAEDFETKVERRLAELEIQQDLVTLMEESGLNQTTLAEIAGVSQPFINKLVSGRATNFELKTLVRAATALDAYVDIKIRRKPKPQSTPRPSAQRAKKSHELRAVAGRH